VSGAALHLKGPGVNSAQRENIGYHRRLAVLCTDSEGNWTCTQVPTDSADIAFFITHPDFARSRAPVRLSGPLTTNVVLSLSRGVSLAGVVTTTQGFPISGASVEEIDPYGGPESSGDTDFNGQFFFAHLNPGPIKLHVKAEGYATVTRTVLVSTNAPEERC